MYVCVREGESTNKIMKRWREEERRRQRQRKKREGETDEQKDN